jgi:hypothetical protein
MAEVLENIHIILTFLHLWICETFQFLLHYFFNSNVGYSLNLETFLELKYQIYKLVYFCNRFRYWEKLVYHVEIGPVLLTVHYHLPIQFNVLLSLQLKHRRYISYSLLGFVCYGFTVIKFYVAEPRKHFRSLFHFWNNVIHNVAYFPMLELLKHRNLETSTQQYWAAFSPSLSCGSAPSAVITLQLVFVFQQHPHGANTAHYNLVNRHFMKIDHLLRWYC